MLDEVDASYSVHGAIRPRQLFFFQVHPMKFTSWRGFCWRRADICSKKPEIRTQFGHMSKGFAVGGSQIQESAVGRGGGNEAGAGVNPWKVPQTRPIHLSSCAILIAGLQRLILSEVSQSAFRKSSGEFD